MKGQGETYANGQIRQELSNEIMTWYFKNGRVKAQGPYIQGKMEGEWTFYRETGELWQTGQLKCDLKHGQWIRYDRAGEVEYQEEFVEGKQVKKKKEAP